MNNMLGVNSKCKARSYVTLYIPVSIYRLMLAWVSSENSTTLLECQLILTHLPSLLWTSSHADWSFCCPVSTGLSVVPHQLPSSSSFVHLPDRCSLPTPGHPRSQVQNPLSGFVPKQTKGSSAWRTTYIVLQHTEFSKVYKNFKCLYKKVWKPIECTTYLYNFLSKETDCLHVSLTLCVHYPKIH